MIKTVIFDFGQVLVHFEPRYMVECYVKDEPDASLLTEVVFDRAYWDRLDAGTITNEETLELCHARLPERLWEVADKIYYNWIYNIPEFEGMSDLIDTLRHKYGKKIFLLSNISNYFASHSRKIPILSKIDKCIFSAPIGSVKPNRAIFEHLCAECGILAEESIFVDDNFANITSAKEFGLNTYRFDGDVSALCAYFDELFGE